MSSWITELLETTRRTNKLHESFLRDLCETYHLTMTEASIICFLKNNPQLDTAADIVEYKMLAKSHVSQAVESLIQKSMLARDCRSSRSAQTTLIPAACQRACDRLYSGSPRAVFSGTFFRFYRR